MRRLLLAVVCALLATFAFGTGLAEESDRPLQRIVTDSSGAELLFEQAPTRIISVAPSLTETVFALGKGEYLVGRSRFCDYPAATEDILSIGSIRSPSIETIVSLEPDVVLASTHFQEDTAQTLADLGIPVVYLYNPNSFEGVYSTIETVGLLLDAEAEAEQLTAEMQADVQEVLTTVSVVDDDDRPSVYYVVAFGQSGDFTAGGDTFIGQMLEMVRADNIAADSEGWAYSFESIVEGDPDLVIASQYRDTRANLESTDGYKDLPAIAEGRLYTFDNNTVDRQGPRLAQGLRALAAIVHPELF